MIDAPPVRPSGPLVAPVLCAECGKPVSHMDARVRGALAGGMCTSDTCVKDRKTGRPKRVYTYNRIAADS
jgi:hypothetical protein